MSESLLTTADQKEALSIVYVKALAVRAGYVTAQLDFDRDGIDMEIHAGGQMRPAIGIQLKATTNLGNAENGCFTFPLKVRNYESLRSETQTPRLLVVLDLPKDENQWMTVNVDELVLRRCVYWINLRGYGETTNQYSVTVKIPEENVLNVESLCTLMDQSRRGRIE